MARPLRPAPRRGSGVAGHILAALCAIALAGCVTTGARLYTTEEMVAATVDGRADLRFFPGRITDMQEALGWRVDGQDRPPPIEGERFDVLALSAGGPDGAFGAGALSGMREAGDRPVYEVVTGISTGAMIAPFVFIGPKHDRFVSSLYRDNVVGELLGDPYYGAALFGASVYSDVAINRFLRVNVTPQFLADIAREHAKGRRLLVATANMDANELTVWNMGLIASLGTPQAAQLFRDVLRASFSIPAALPPVEINAATGSRDFTELHGDGGLLAYFFVDPGLVPPAYRKPRGGEPAPRFDIILHNQIEARPDPVNPRVIALAGKSISSLTRTAMNLLLDKAIRDAADSGTELRYAHLPRDWGTVSSVQFDREYMRKTWDLGNRLARDGQLWRQGSR